MSWTRAHRDAFAAQGIALRTAVDSLACIFRGKEVDLCIAPLQRQEVLSETGPQILMTTTGRIPFALLAAGAAPVEGETIQVKLWGVTLVITGLSPQTLVPEWRVHLQQQ